MTTTPLPTLTRTVEFFVPGKPVAWARAGARAGIAGNGKAFVRHFTKPTQRPYAALLRDASVQAMRANGDTGPCWEGPLELTIIATYSRPKSHFTTKGALTSRAPSCYTSKPDLDNLVKMVGDALNGVLWNDDSQIIKCTALKVWGDREGVGVHAREGLSVCIKEARVQQ